MTNKQVDTWCQEHLDIMIGFARQEWNIRFFTCKGKWDWSPRRTTAWGGSNGISIPMNKYYKPKVSKNNVIDYTEYKSFTNDLVIGGFYSDNWQLAMLAVICHEVAHAIHDKLGKIGKPHGNEWKSIYRKLRIEFINKNINKTLKKSFTTIDTGKKDYQQYCLKHLMKSDWFGKSFVSRGNSFTITGWNITARKYFVKVLRADNKVFKMTPTDVVYCINKESIYKIEKQVNV